MYHKRFKEWLKTFYKTHEKPVKIGGIVLVALVMGFAVYKWAVSDDQIARTDPDSDSSQNEGAIKIVASPLTGLSVEEALAKRPVTAIVIENSPDARPQSSLNEAGLVFESIAEGGITRYVAFYQEAQPDFIGPVRSLRPYFLDMILAFDASVAHVGGSAKAINQANSLGVKSLNQFYNASAYDRVNFRFAPHNVYTDFKRIDKLNKSKGFNSSEFHSWPRKDDAPVTPAKARLITVKVSSDNYNSSYTYHPKTNSYRRSLGGVAQRDRETKERISPKVIIVARIANSVDFSTGRYSYDLVDSGKATIFQDGKVISATWKKTSRDGMMTFVDANGDEIALNKGQVWLTAISPGTAPGYKR